MDISVNLSTRFPHILSSPLPSSFSAVSSLPALRPPHDSATAAITTTTTIVVKGQTPATTLKSRRNQKSDSYLSRKSAVLQVQQSSDLASSLQRFGGILKVQDLNAILRHFGEQNRWQDLSQLFYWMQLHGKTSVSSYSSYIKFLGKSLKPLKALEIYNNITDESTKTNVFICNSILSCLVRNGKLDSGIKLFDKMKTPDAVTYNTAKTLSIRMDSQEPDTASGKFVYLAQLSPQNGSYSVVQEEMINCLFTFLDIPRWQYIDI